MHIINDKDSDLLKEYSSFTTLGDYVYVQQMKVDGSFFCKDSNDYFHKCNSIEHGKQIVEQIWLNEIKKCFVNGEEIEYD